MKNLFTRLTAMMVILAVSSFILNAEVKLPDKTQQQPNLSQQTPTVLFNAMVNPMVGYGIRGGIWYQGEANRNEADKYVQLLPGLVENWRSVWGVGEFPFYYVQIAPYDYGQPGSPCSHPL